MAKKKKGSKARDQRRRTKRAQHRKKRTTGSATSPAPPAPFAAAPHRHQPPLQDEYDVAGGGPEGGFYIDPHGRPATIQGRKLKVVPEEERDALGVNVPAVGVFGDFLDFPVPPDAVYVIQPPTMAAGVATMRVGVRGASDTEVDGVIWHPTYTATVRWDHTWEEGEWVFEVQQDYVPGDPVGRCGLGPDGTDEFWEGSGDRASDMAVAFAADHLQELLRLAQEVNEPS